MLLPCGGSGVGGSFTSGGGYGNEYEYGGSGAGAAAVGLGGLAEPSLPSATLGADGGYNNWSNAMLPPSSPMPVHKHSTLSNVRTTSLPEQRLGMYTTKAASRLGPLSGASPGELLPRQLPSEVHGARAWAPAGAGPADSFGISEGVSLPTAGEAGTKRRASDDTDSLSDRKLQQKLRKREAARKRYHQQQQRLSDLKLKVEFAAQRNVDLNNKLTKLLEEQDALASRERELVEKQKKARAEIEELRAVYKTAIACKAS